MQRFASQAGGGQLDNETEAHVSHCVGNNAEDAKHETM